MGCGCGGGGGQSAKASVQQYMIQGDPEGKEYMTEREAITAAQSRELDGTVVPVGSSK